MLCHCSGEAPTRLRGIQSSPGQGCHPRGWHQSLGEFSSAVTLVRTAGCAGQEGARWEGLAQVSPLITAHSEAQCQTFP